MAAALRAAGDRLHELRAPHGVVARRRRRARAARATSPPSPSRRSWPSDSPARRSGAGAPGAAVVLRRGRRRDRLSRLMVRRGRRSGLAAGLRDRRRRGASSRSSAIVGGSLPGLLVGTVLIGFGNGSTSSRATPRPTLPGRTGGRRRSASSSGRRRSGRSSGRTSSRPPARSRSRSACPSWPGRISSRSSSSAPPRS